ncbi:MAG: dihydrofolate reductase [Bacteroidales bacterium]|nr:dihydrofolate reductase [Bacteroidales bacterium]HPH00020.1 dihydrofolate reductase [Tenuifilaceae bacterium]
MNRKIMALLLMAATGFSTGGCKSGNEQAEPFKWQVDQFADLRIMRYQIPGFDSLTPKQRVLVYYLSEAAKCGRDIIWDQNYKFNLDVRSVLEGVYQGYKGNRNDPRWGSFMVYLKRVWFSNGIHHHYSTDKIMPDFDRSYFAELVGNTPSEMLPKKFGGVDSILAHFTPIIFDADVAPKRVNQLAGSDLVTTSACNYYEGVTQAEAEEFYSRLANPNDSTPISYGLNSKLVKKNGKIEEQVWYANGMYGKAIGKIVFWLEKAATVAENEYQQKIIETLVDYYKTGDLRKFDEYNILWLSDTQSKVDFVNGFIETYGDPLGYKGSWESVVNFRNDEATHRTEVISANAQWFEDHSPIDSIFKKKEVKGVSAKVITVAQLGGDCYPSTPIGINLPNADWIRKQHGSKSVTMDNITYAYNQASLGNGFMEEFAWSDEEVALNKQYGYLADCLHTDLHECLGHGSGQLAPGVKGDELKNYGSPLEEARADLFALYYIMDPKMVELGLMPNLDVARVQYSNYIRNGLMTQLTRVEPGKNIEQAHMRNRQLIAQWCYEYGKDENVVERKNRNGKTYFVVNDFQKLRQLFGSLLREIQRIKSSGDYESGKKLVESFGVKVDPALHHEVLERYSKLNLAPYGGFINPDLVPVVQNDSIVDVRVDYPEDYARQMLEYSERYSFLTK